MIPNECCPESKLATLLYPYEHGWEQAPDVVDATTGSSTVNLYGKATHEIAMPAVQDGMAGMARAYHGWLAVDMSFTYWTGVGANLVNAGIPVPRVTSTLLDSGLRMQPRPGTMPGLYIYEPDPIGGADPSGSTGQQSQQMQQGAEPGEEIEENWYEGSLFQYGAPIETGATPSSTAIFSPPASFSSLWPVPSAPVVYTNQLSGAQLWHFGTFLEVRYVDGSVARFESFDPYSTPQKGKLWRVDWVKDPYDNHAEYSYDNAHRLISIAFPSGLTQKFNYAPGWSNWSGATLFEVSYEQTSGSTTTPLTEQTWGLAFVGGSPSGGKHFGGVLSRTYSAPRRVLQDPSTGVPHTISGSSYVTGQIVYEFTYNAGARLVTESQSVHTGAAFDNSLTIPAGLSTLAVAVTEFLSASPNRVSRQVNSITGSDWVITYSSGTRTTDLLPGVTSLQAVTSTDAIGGSQRYEFDPPSGRLYSVILTPNDNPQGRPRAHDSTNSTIGGAAGDVEPEKIEIYNIFNSSCVCQKPIERQIRSTRASAMTTRTTKYEYDVTNKLLTKLIEPNPETGSGPFVATREWKYTYMQATTSGQVWGAWLPMQEVTPDGTWYFLYDDWQNRANATQHGRIPGKTTRQMTNVRLASALDGSSTATTYVEEIVYRNLPNSPGSMSYQGNVKGQPRKVVDGDGVPTVYSYTSEGWLEHVYKHNSTVQRTYVRDVAGNVTEIRDNDTAVSGLKAVTTFPSQSGSGLIYELQSSSGGLLRASEFYYDRFGHLAVARKNNLDSSGNAPSKHGSGGSSARSWIDSQFHFLHHHLEFTFQDRKPLDEAAGTGQYLSTRYEYLANGRLGTVTNPNGSVTNYDFDGFGTLYRTVSTHSGAVGSVSSPKSFVNAFLEETGVYEKSGADNLWTLIQRNDAGAITKITEPSTTAPSGYTGSTGGAYHEFELDKMGRVVESRSYAPGGVSPLRRREIRYDQLSRQYWQQDHVIGFGSGSHYTAWRYKPNRIKQLDNSERTGIAPTSYAYNADGFLTSLTDGAGNTVGYTYFANTPFVSLVTCTDQEPGSGTRITMTSYEVDPFGRITKVRDGGDLDHLYAYNSLGRVDRYTDPAGKVQKFLPDALGRIVEHVRLEGSGGYIHNSTDFVDGGQTDGRTKMTRWDGLSHNTVTHYDYVGRPFIVQNPGSSATAPTPSVPNQGMSLFAEYDDASRITAIHDGDGGKTQYWRDGSGRMIQRAMVKHGALISLWNTKEILKRDAIGRLTEMSVFGSLAAPGGVPDHALLIATEEFQTDSLGRTHREKYNFTFAPANALEVTSAWSGGDPFRGGLDYADNLGSGLTAPLSMGFGHDAIGRMASIDWTGHSGSTTALADYEWVGSLRRNRFVRYGASSYPEGKTSFGYDQYNRLTQIKDDVYTASSTFTTKSQFDYEYDEASNLLKEKYAKVGGGVGDRFAYDGYHRLTKAWMGVDATLMADPANPAGWISGQMHSYLTYGLDDANNRTGTEVQSAGGTASTDYDLQGSSHPQGPSNRYNAVGPLGGGLTPYEYDGRGNLIRDGVFVFRYDYLNRLQEVWKIRVDGDDDDEQYALVQEGADEEARQEVRLEVPDLMRRLPREHMNPTFRARLRAQITGGVIRLRGTGLGGSSRMQNSTTSAMADLHAVYAYDAYNRRIMGVIVGVDVQLHTLLCVG